METIVEIVERWFAENREAIAAGGGSMSILSHQSLDAGHGKVAISLETQRVLASITLWNRRQIEVLAVDKMTRADHTLIDRSLNLDEDIASLLSRILHQIAVDRPIFTRIEEP